MQEQQLAWSLYWMQDKLHSCVASGSGQDQAILESRWHDFAKSLPCDAQVLDLATGNGAVVVSLMQVRDDLKIDAIDKAEIDPLTYLSQSELLAGVNFHAQVDILELPFDESSFDAVTSQFGIEYAGATEAIISVLPLLKLNGSLQFIMHHADSDVIKSSRSKLQEFERIVAPQGLLDTLQSVIFGGADLSDLENCGARYMQNEVLRTQQISGQVFAGIDQIIKLLEVDSKQAIKLSATLNMRVRYEYERLLQMKNSAKNVEQMSELCLTLRSEGVEVIKLEPIYIDSTSEDYLLGWLLCGQRAE